MISLQILSVSVGSSLLCFQARGCCWSQMGLQSQQHTIARSWHNSEGRSKIKRGKRWQKMYFFQHNTLIVRPKTSLTSLNVMFSDIHLATLVFHIATFTCLTGLQLKHHLYGRRLVNEDDFKEEVERWLISLWYGAVLKTLLPQYQQSIVLRSY